MSEKHNKDSLVGENIGQFEVVRELGRGGMGVVYKAHEKSLGRMVALKILPNHLSCNETFVRRFKREARAVAQLSHPNVVTIHNITSEGDNHFIVMEYIQGESLSALLEREKTVPFDRAIDIARQVARAIAAAGEQKIVHRDIKPQNIMLEPDGRVIVMDFGIAKILGHNDGDMTEAGDVMGTPTYMSPEQCRGHELDSRSDIFALGGVLYQMLTGTPPFRSSEPLSTIQKILFENPPPFPELEPPIPRMLQRICLKALARDVGDRYEDGYALEAALGKCQHELQAKPSAFKMLTGDALASITGSLPESVRDQVNTQTSKGRRNLGLSAAGVFIFLGLFWLLASGGSDESDPVVASATPVPTEAASVLIQPPVDLSNPLEWVRAPEPGSSVASVPIELEWEYRNDFPETARDFDGFLIEVNGDRVTLSPLQTTYSFTPAGVGEYTVQILPFRNHAEDGDPLFVSFRYETNEAPTLMATLIKRAIQPGEMISIEASAEDADADFLTLEVRTDGGAWTETRLPIELSWNETGQHSIELRALDARGAQSDVWSELVDVETPEAALNKALGFYSGIGGEVNDGRARALIKLAAATDSPTARMWLAWFLHWGRSGFDPAPEQAYEIARIVFPKVEMAAQEGDAESAFLIGAALDRGIGTAENPEVAANWIKLSAEKDHPFAMNYLGYFYFAGRGLEQDLEEAVRWFEAAAQVGEVNAMHNLGWMYLRGQGVEADPQTGVDWFRRGAAAGNTVTMNNLGMVYEQGLLDGNVDLSEALRWYAAAAKQGSELAAKNVERLLEVMKPPEASLAVFDEASSATLSSDDRPATGTFHP